VDQGYHQPGLLQKILSARRCPEVEFEGVDVIEIKKVREHCNIHVL